MRSYGMYLLVLLMPVCSHATDVYLQAGLHFGGDDLITAEFTNGDTEKLKAGELISFSAGIAVALSESLESRIGAGIKFDTIDAENGGVDFTRYPVTALLMYSVSERIKLGGGVSYHLNPSISSDGVASGSDFDFDNSLGLVAEVDYIFVNGLYLGIKLTRVDYEAKGVSVSGDSIGGILGFLF